MLSKGWLHLQRWTKLLELFLWICNRRSSSNYSSRSEATKSFPTTRVSLPFKKQGKREVAEVSLGFFSTSFILYHNNLLLITASKWKFELYFGIIVFSIAATKRFACLNLWCIFRIHLSCRSNRNRMTWWWEQALWSWRAPGSFLVLSHMVVTKFFESQSLAITWVI